MSDTVFALFFLNRKKLYTDLLFFFSNNVHSFSKRSFRKAIDWSLYFALFFSTSASLCGRIYVC